MKDDQSEKIEETMRKIAEAGQNEVSELKTKRKHLVFRLADERYGIPLSLVKEVIALVDITPIPHAPRFYKGMINLRGQIISVIDLRVKLAVKEIPFQSKKTSIVISHVGDILVGAIVDEVIEVVGYEKDQLDTVEAERVERNGDGIYGIAKDSEGQLTLLINIERALNKTDFKVLKEQAA